MKQKCKKKGGTRRDRDSDRESTDRDVLTTVSLPQDLGVVANLRAATTAEWARVASFPEGDGEAV